MKRAWTRRVAFALGVYSAVTLGAWFAHALAAGKDAGAHVVVPTDSASIAAGAKVFKQYCVPCHGATGRGDGPTAAALKPKPRNFTHPKEFKSKNDDEIFAVINKGGAASKLSPVMPPWGTTLKRPQILQVMAFVHSLAPPDSASKPAAKDSAAAK